MFVFEVLFLIGTLGFGAMVFLAGLSGASGHGHGGHHGHSIGDGHAHGHSHSGHSPSAVGDHQAAIASHFKGGAPRGTTGNVAAGLARFARLKSIFFLSPLDIFALCLGGGATGLVLRTAVSPSLLPWLAFLGAILLDYGVVRPFLTLAFSFASKPSEALEETVARSAHAISKFDRDGRGLVTLTLDGQTVQLLAQLDSEDRSKGVQVVRGDEVVILEVDAHRNSCRVTRQLSP